MRIYFDEEDLDGQFQRTLTHAYERGADLGEAFATAARITAGDDESWYREWSAAAATAQAAAETSRAVGRIQSASDAFLRASEYHRQAMFYLRGDIGDPRLKQSYLQMRDCFRAAIPGLAFNIEPVRIPYEGTTLSGYLMTPHGPGDPRPTVLFPAGYDSVAEEGYLYGSSAVRRGYTVLSLEGPGQGRRRQTSRRLQPQAGLRGSADARGGLRGHQARGGRGQAGAVRAGRSPADLRTPGRCRRAPDRGTCLRSRSGGSGREGDGTRARPGAGADPGERPEDRRPDRPDDGNRRCAQDVVATHGCAWHSERLRGYLRALLEFTLEDRAADITCPTLDHRRRR